MFIVLVVAGPALYVFRFGTNAHKSESSRSFGEVDIVSYSAPVEFESGPAVIKINLASNGQSYFIHHLRINSAIYTELQE